MDIRSGLGLMMMLIRRWKVCKTRELPTSLWLASRNRHGSKWWRPRVWTSYAT